MKSDTIVDSKLLKIFRLLDKEETRRFKKLLQSPFFTTNPHLLRLFNFFTKYYPDFNHAKLTKAVIFTHLFPDKSYNDDKLRMLLREFTRQLEDFLIIKEVQTNKQERKKHLIDSYSQRNEMELFKKGTFSLLKEMKAIPIKNNHYFFEKQRLLQQLIYHPAIPKTTAIIGLQTELMEYLELHYWSNKIWMSCNLLSTKQFLNIDVQDLETSIKSLPSAYLLKSAPLAVYYKAFHFLKSPSDNHYLQLKSAYLRSIEELAISDKRDLYVYLSNYAVRQHNQGNLLFLKETFEWNQVGLKYKLLIEADRMDENIFKNCCLTAIRLNDFAWAEKFIENYADFLNKKNKQDVISFCQAYLYFYNKNYDQLIETILNYRFLQFRDNLGVKGLLLRSYFELFLIDDSYFEVLMAFSHAYERFLRRNKSIAKHVIKEYLNFIIALRKITKLIHEGNWNNEHQEKFNTNILQEKIALKQWILDKINYL